LESGLADEWAIAAAGFVNGYLDGILKRSPRLGDSLKCPSDDALAPCHVLNNA